MPLNTPTSPLPFAPVPPTETLWPLSISQYHQMVQAGILTEEDPVELLEGLLVTKMPKNPPHRLSTQLTREALSRLLPSDWFVEDQEPITTQDSEPEPDLAVIRGTRRDYSDRHPSPADVGLIIEVADATLQRDRTRKKRIYAQAGIAIYWIINLVDRQIEVYSNPQSTQTEPDYLHQQNYQVGDELLLLLDSAEVGRVSVQDLLP